MSKKKSKKTTTASRKSPAANSASKNGDQTKTAITKKTPADTKPLASQKPQVSKEAASSQASTASKQNTEAEKPIVNKQSLADQEASLSKQQSVSKKNQSTQQSPQTGTQTVQPNTKKSGSGLSIFAILISLIALGATGFSWYLTHIKTINSNTDLAVGVTEISGQVTRISDSVIRLQSEQVKVVTQAQLTSKLLESRTSVDKQVLDLKQTQNQLSESLTKVNESLQKGTNQYVIDEVSQLLKLGNNSAIFSGDAQSAIKAFTLADIQLKELANPRFSEVRRKINEEILLLKSVKQTDTESVIATLNAISNSISQLPLENEPPVVNVPEQESEAQKDESITWRSGLKRMWSDVLNSITIQKIDQPPKPLLAPKERYFLNQNIQLQLVKAEIALLQNRQSTFDNSIKEASTWLNEYFDLDNDEVKNALQELRNLKSVALKNDLPAIAGSYDLLQSIKGGQ